MLRLFSREHAQLTLGESGAFLRDVRRSGIQDATILNGEPLEKDSIPIMLFPGRLETATTATRW